MAAYDDADRIAFEQKTRQPDIALARHAIDLVDVMRFEAFGQQAGDGAAHRCEFLVSQSRSHLTAVPAKAGTHFSAPRLEGCVPAFAVTMVKVIGHRPATPPSKRRHAAPQRPPRFPA